jgi:ADP-ribose pyrophosphatase YjhB (NUDIX family)
VIKVVYAGEEPPEEWDASVFLAGPTPRRADVPSWRPDVIEEIEQRHKIGLLVVFVPEPPDGSRYPAYDDQIAWEERWLDAADVILFWVPRAMSTLPGLTTNVEFGRYESSGRVVFGAPDDAEHVKYLKYHARQNGAPVTSTVQDTVGAALEMIGSGVRRVHGERHLPLIVWKSASFRNWLTAQQKAGNVLLDGKVAWTRGTFLWVVHARIRITAEDRVKDNEVVLSRPDVVSIVAYRRGETVLENEIVLVREFRLPSCSADGYVRELPGGGVLNGSLPVAQAQSEMAEETGLHIAPDRLRLRQVRQSMATLSAHRMHVFSVELTTEEIARARENPGPYGLDEDSERTFVEVLTYAEILTNGQADWATLGVLSAVFTAPEQ